MFYPIDKSHLLAQTSENDSTADTWYFSATMGGSLLKGTGNIGGAVITLRRNNWSIISAGGSRGENNGLYGYLGLLYNQFLIYRSYFASVGAGVTYTYRVENRFASSWQTVGLPIEAKVLYRVFPCVGAGAMLFTNINSEKSFSGFLFCLQIGKL
jgi:hypothetical protein